MAALLLASAASAVAQQKITFSKPADTTAEKDTPSQAAPNGQRWSIGVYNAPKSILNNAPDSPMPRPIYYQPPSPAAQDAWNKRKNWTLLTPEQIMGLQTPEQILGLPNPNGDSKLSLEQQFLLRETRTGTSSATNGRAMLRENAGPFAMDRDRQGPFARDPNSRTDEGKGAAGFLTRLLNGSPSVDDRKANSAWTSVFAQPTQPKPTPAQIDSMERFRALMVPSSPPDKQVTPAGFSPAPTRNPYLQPQPAFNPAGRSAAPVQDNINRPTGIQPLPGTATKPAESPAKRPTWQAQLPPWMLDKPQTHNANHGF